MVHSKVYFNSAQERQTFLKNLLEVGPTTDGFPSEPCNLADISWADYDLIEKGKALREKFFAPVHFAESVAQVFGFVAKQVAAPTFTTLSSVPCCRKRFLSTRKVLQVDWIDSDFKNDDFLRSIKRVRNYHKAKARPKEKPDIPSDGYPKYCKEVSLAVQNDLDWVKIPREYPFQQMSWEPAMFFSQLDLAFVMLTYAPLLLYPEKVGIYLEEGDEEGVLGILHALALVARLLGLKDEFNIALYPDVELFKELEELLLLPTLKTIDEPVVFALYRAGIGHWGRSTLGMITPKVVLQFLYDEKHVKGTELWKTLGYKERTAYWVGKKIVNATKWNAFRGFFNKVVKYGFQLEMWLFHKDY